MNEDLKEGRTMLRVTLGGSDYVLSWETGVQVLSLMRDATPVHMQYSADYRNNYWKRAENLSISATVFTVEEQAKLLMGGGEEP